MKKVLLLSASPRKGGNSDILCDEFMRGAVEAGNKAEKIFLREKITVPAAVLVLFSESRVRRRMIWLRSWISSSRRM